MGILGTLMGWNSATSAYEKIKSIDGKLRAITQGYLYAVAEGHIANHEVWSKSGVNLALSASEEDMWSVGDTYVYPAAAQQMEVVSSSTDDAAAGTGARTVTIRYLTAAFAEKSETVTLDGTTPVATTNTDIYRIQSFRIATAGTGGAAAGNIDIRNLADTPIYSRIAIGEARAKDIVYTVPANKVLYITEATFSVGASTSGRSTHFITKAKYDNASGVALDFFMDYTDVFVQDSQIQIFFQAPTRFPAGTDIKVSAISPDGMTYGAVSLKGWLESA